MSSASVWAEPLAAQLDAAQADAAPDAPAVPSPPASALQLDARQRAMLQEMGVAVWLPDAIESLAKPALPTAVATKNIAAYAQLASVPAAFAVRNQGASVLGERPAGIEGMDWPALAQAAAQCTACGLCQGRSHSVFGAGSTQARWLVLGDAPGDAEDASGQPFAGPAGQLLGNMLRALGLSRTADAPQAAVYLSHVLKCRPSQGRKAEPQELAQCAPFLQRQIALLQPQIILALGKAAAEALLQASVPDVASLPLGKLRGQVHRYAGIPVVVSYPLEVLLRSPGEKAKAWADLCLAQAAHAGAHPGP